MPARLPLVPTLVVAAAVGLMIALGIWQLGRAEWKGNLISRYERAIAMSSEVPWPTDPAAHEDSLYRRTTIVCDRVLGIRGGAGRSEHGRQGWMQIARCQRDGGGEVDVAIGWSREPQAPAWDGGEVQGMITPAGEGVRLVAMPPQAGLQPLATPDPGELPNNHLSYAFQWFFFAATAIVVYILALRRRAREAG